MMSHTQDGYQGFSPLHAALWPEGRPNPTAEAFPIPHLSFKPHSVVFDKFGKQKAGNMALKWVQDKGFLLAQGCQSTYGAFWYLLHQDATRQLYVKPRINLRDA